VKRSSRFVALLRGINLGGKNVISKQDLARCFDGLGFTNVRTYIQSGNLLFRSDKTGIKTLTKRIEQGLSKRFSYEAQAAVLSFSQYRTAVEAAPKSWGKNDTQTHNALFMLDGITVEKVLAQLPALKSKIETVTPGPGVVFWSASKAQLTKTTLMKLSAAPVYRQMTVRNHNTVFKLLELFEEI